MGNGQAPCVAYFLTVELCLALVNYGPTLLAIGSSASTTGNAARRR
jgi:hypothetical protein